jgi:hypothetical protein
MDETSSSQAGPVERPTRSDTCLVKLAHYPQVGPFVNSAPVP